MIIMLCPECTERAQRDPDAYANKPVSMATWAAFDWVDTGFRGYRDHYLCPDCGTVTSEYVLDAEANRYLFDPSFTGQYCVWWPKMQRAPVPVPTRQITPMNRDRPWEWLS